MKVRALGEKLCNESSLPGMEVNAVFCRENHGWFNSCGERKIHGGEERNRRQSTKSETTIEVAEREKARSRKE